MDRIAEREQVVVADEIAGVVRVRGEALSAVGRLVEPVTLDHGPHRPVEHQDPLVQQGGQLRGRVGSVTRRPW
jgi:hypothetical protein